MFKKQLMWPCRLYIIDFAWVEKKCGLKGAQNSRTSIVVLVTQFHWM